MTVVKTEDAIRAFDHHAERLEAKLSFLIRSCEDTREDSLYQCERKIATVKQEIDDMIEQKTTLHRLKQMSIIGYSAM